VSGSIDAQGNIHITITTPGGNVNHGVTLVYQLTGKAKWATSGISASGTWKVIDNVEPGGIAFNGHGTWTAKGTLAPSAFDGTYMGSGKGTLVESLKRRFTRFSVPGPGTPVPKNMNITLLINDGVITAMADEPNGIVGTVSGSIDAHGNVHMTITTPGGNLNGRVTLIYQLTGKAKRTSSGLQLSGTWTVTDNVAPNGAIFNGHGTWSVNSTD
jgi:hypothetical protein